LFTIFNFLLFAVTEVSVHVTYYIINMETPDDIIKVYPFYIRLTIGARCRS